MATINPYNTNSGSDGGSKKGSSENPYTQEEFEQMQDAGTWQGGYVEGMGYWMGVVTVTASYPDSDSFGSEDSWPSEDSWSSDTSYPFGNGTNPPTGGGGGGIGGNNMPGGGSNGNSGTSTGGSDNNGGQSLVYNTNVPDVLPISAFRGYLSSEPAGCLNRCREMLAIANCQLSGKEIAMTHYDSNGRATIATDNFKNGLNYIDGQLQRKKPVIVAVDYKDKTSMGSTRLDQAGDHFVIIVGGGQTHGYHYYDPATQYQERGTSSDNKFMINEGLMRSTNICTGSIHNYILTSIRENK